MTPGATPRMAGWLESAWLARYLDRQLEGEELAWFEAYLLETPELLRMVEADNVTRDALHALTMRLSGGLTGTSADQSRENSLKSMPEYWHRPHLRKRAWNWTGLAASLLLGSCIGFFGFHLTSHHVPSSALVGSPTRVVFDVMRGGPEVVTVEHSDSSSPFVLVEIAVPPDAEQFVLNADSGQKLSLSPTPDGFVSVLVPREVFDSTISMTLEFRIGSEESKVEIELQHK